MTQPVLYTIGHSNHPSEDFIALLRRHDIEILADVRSVPSSRHNPQFNKPNLKAALSGAGIDYVFLGKELGARRDEPEAYEGGAVSYERVAELPAFRDGLNRLRETAHARSLALMCAEKEPLDCHRTILVCRHLRGEFSIRHILADGTSEAHDHLEQRLIARMDMRDRQDDLFEDSDESLLERAYRHRGRQMAYRPRK